jgi:hypothetical protein
MVAEPSALRSESRPQAALHRILLAAYGAEELVAGVIGSAMVTANRTSVPKGPRELIDFVKGHVLPIASADLGPRIAMALLDELAQELELELSDAFDVPFPGTEAGSHERSSLAAPRLPTGLTSPPVSGARVRPSVLLVDANRFQRSALARALVADGFDVRVSETVASLAAELSSSEPLHLVVVDTDHPQIEALLERLVDSRPDLPVLATARAFGPATATLRAAGVQAFDVRLKDAPMDDVLGLIKRTVRG